MWKYGFILSIALVLGVFAKAQISTSFTSGNNQDFDKVKFSLQATEGKCYIEPGEETTLLNIKSDAEEVTVPKLEERIEHRTKQIKVQLDQQGSYLGSSLSKRLFSKQETDDYSWKVYLSKYKPMDLDLNYAVGDTYIDLSGLPVERLKMRTGSANVYVDYRHDQSNKVMMDTFLIRVDMGTFKAKNLHLSRSEHVIADVGFGSLHMDFKHAVVMSTAVDASVGAGKLEVILPASDIPVKININDSPLCQIRMPKSFRRASSKEFVKGELNDSPDNYLTFNVDVAVGNIVFK